MSLLLTAALLASQPAPYADCFRNHPVPAATAGSLRPRTLADQPPANAYKLVLRSGAGCARATDVRFNVDIPPVRPAGAPANRR
jgi:hypothetical protein